MRSASPLASKRMVLAMKRKERYRKAICRLRGHKIRRTFSTEAFGEMQLDGTILWHKNQILDQEWCSRCGKEFWPNWSDIDLFNTENPKVTAWEGKVGGGSWNSQGEPTTFVVKS